MKEISKQAKKNLTKAALFVGGIIASTVINKIFDKVAPNNPVIVKEYTDTIKLVHDYRIPNELNNDSARLELEKRLKNLELLNDYEKQIKEKMTSIEGKVSIIPNLILTNNYINIKSKGYTYGSSSAYFTSNIPDLSKEFIDLKIKFINPSITKEIACLRVNIYKYKSLCSDEAQIYIFDELYEVKSNDNLIRISNDLAKGKYEILCGFILKSELEKKYPSFNFKKYTVIK